MFDFWVSARRDDAIDTLSAEKKFEGLKIRGEQKRNPNFFIFRFSKSPLIFCSEKLWTTAEKRRRH